jgi:hypothetical protein
MKSNRQKDSTDFQPDALGELPMTIAKYAFYIGLFLVIGGFATTLFLMNIASGDQTKIQQISSSIDLFQKVMVSGVLGLALGSAWLFWEEEFMVFGNLVGAGFLLGAPTLIPMVISFNNNPAVQDGYKAIGAAGMLWIAIAGCVLVGDLALRIRNRMVHGTKAELLKYGNKKMMEEGDRQNVFMGKCWQLPYCRKYVREKCPIFHSKRTCWKELVGCMCEESVIRAAIDNKPVSKEALMSGAAIPRNNKLSVSAKRERCKTCVIYNEHQKHKYRLAMPVVIIGYILFFALFRLPLTKLVESFLGGASKAVSTVTAGTVQKVDTGAWFTQFLVLALLITALAYTIKMVEYAIFKLKI